jgi:hypothetical protein
VQNDKIDRARSRIVVWRGTVDESQRAHAINLDRQRLAGNA